MTAQYAPLEWANVTEHLRKIAQAANDALSGKINNVGTVTLTANAATTTVSNRRVTAGCHVGFMPTTANAATEFGAGTMYVSTRTQGASFVITHTNNAQTDRTFTYELIAP